MKAKVDSAKIMKCFTSKFHFGAVRGLMFHVNVTKRSGMSRTSSNLGLLLTQLPWFFI